MKVKLPKDKENSEIGIQVGFPDYTETVLADTPTDIKSSVFRVFNPSANISKMFIYEVEKGSDVGLSLPSEFVEYFSALSGVFLEFTEDTEVTWLK